MSDNQKQCCSFCGKDKSEVPKGKLVSSNPSDSLETAICLSCAEDAINHISIDDDFTIIDEHAVRRELCMTTSTGNKKPSFGNPAPIIDYEVETLTEEDPYNCPVLQSDSLDLTPHKIKEKMDGIIVGQHKAKKTLAVAAYNHLLRVRNAASNDKINKSNVLMIGPTGTGKTMFARAIAEIMGLPFAEVDATTITTAGYNGADAKDCIETLLIKCNYNTEQAGLGVIFVDEIDKLRVTNDGGLDVSGEGAQQALLKIIEGTQVVIKKEREGIEYTVDTSKILFIGSGAFTDIQKPEAAGIGFGAAISNPKDAVTPQSPVTNEQIGKFGLTKEFIGRFPIKITLDELTVNDIYRILFEPENSEVSQFSKLFELSGFKLEVEDSALMMIAKQAYENKVGARGLRAILESYFEDIMFELPSKRNEGLKIVATENGPVFI